MKIAIAQINPMKGNIQKNIDIHKIWIEIAISEDVDFITFSELSLTSYEPKLAKELAMGISDIRLDVFQQISNQNDITIGLGTPLQSESGIHISMVIFQPNLLRKIYSKQRLHDDELPYFTCGKEQLILSIEDKKIAPAICYESLQKEHTEYAKKLGANIYLASVAKAQNGVEKAYLHYPKIAKAFSMPVLMSNSIGFCDNFMSAGQSAVWNSKGNLKAQLNADTEGIIIFDTETEDVIKKEKQALFSH